MNSSKAAQQGVPPTGGSRRVFKQFAWLGAGSVKVALARLAHQRVTPAVGRQPDLQFALDIGEAFSYAPTKTKTHLWYDLFAN